MIERIGDIVRVVCERENCPLDELARRSSVPLSILTALVHGQPGITTTQLNDVAEALSLDPTALLNGREVLRRVPSVFLRHAPIQDFDDRDSATLDDALDQGRNLANLRALLGQPALELQAGTFAQREAAADRPEAPALDGHRLAREVRRRLGNEAEPLADMREELEARFGVAVLVRPFKSNQVTVVGIRAETCAAIVLSTGDTQRARNPLLTRVYLAHDLCHVLFDPSQGGLHIVIDSAADRRFLAAEQRARAFAAELLLPLAGLTQLLGPPREVNQSSAALDLIVQARSRFGTPHEITANHLCNLHFIDRRLRAWLEVERTTFTGILPQTSLPETGVPSQLVAEYVERAHRKELLTDGEARAILGIDQLALLPWDEVQL